MTDREMGLLERAEPAVPAMEKKPALTRTHTIEVYDGRTPDISYNPDDPAVVANVTKQVNDLLAHGYQLFPEGGDAVRTFNPMIETYTLTLPLVGG